MFSQIGLFFLTIEGSLVLVTALSEDGELEDRLPLRQAVLHAESNLVVTSIRGMTEHRQITLGDPQKGVVLTPLNGWTKFHYKSADKYEVILVQKGIVKLKNHAEEFTLMSDGEKVFIEMWGILFEFSPFLNLRWLRQLLGLQ